jgi:hypothetical protein
MGLRRSAALVAAVPLLLAAAPAASADTPYLAGAARVEITPPAYQASQDATEFPGCNTTVFNGPRQFAFEEPYIDTDDSGDFNYPSGEPEPFCDANANGRWEGIYSSGGVDHLVKEVHDPIDARAIALSDGTHTVVIVSVVAQGLFENYVAQMRADAKAMRPGIDDVVVSANHNESSPDTIGIYGAPPVPEDIPVLGGAVGENSGIDEYYMDYLVHRVAQAAAFAYDARVPASLWATDFQFPPEIDIHLSNNFPTTNDDGSPAAIDPKVRVLQARDADGAPIATMMNLAAHNQEIGHSGDPALQDELSSDWPGFFASRLEHEAGGGMGMFLVGDNGSEEDPQTVPAVPSEPPHDCPDGCYAQAEATGVAIADSVAAHLPDATELGAGAVSSQRRILFLPLENNLFVAAAGAGLFGERQLYTGGVPTGRTGQDLRTSVGVVDVGPDLQFISNPGEAFPALMVGSPWGIEDAGCPERPNPPVPTWHAYAANRFQIGLADDMIGYELPAWAFSSLPGALDYQGAPATCVDDIDDKDPKGHQHKLETEGAGPTASNGVAQNLTELLDQQPDPAAQVRRGRYVYADGTLSRRPQRAVGGGGSENAVAIWLADPGSSTLSPQTGTIVALGQIGAFGDRAVDAAGSFMDFDGQVQDASPDITTRGMLSGGAPSPSARYYLDLYPALQTTPLGAERDYCTDDTAPASAPDRSRLHARPTRFRIAGGAEDVGCDGGATQVARPGDLDAVTVAVWRRAVAGGCRFLRKGGHLGRPHPCDDPVWLPAQGTRHWRLRLALTKKLPRARYHARSQATDHEGNVEAASASNTLSFLIRRGHVAG